MTHDNNETNLSVEVAANEHIEKLEVSVYDGRASERVQIGHPWRYLVRHLASQRQRKQIPSYMYVWNQY